MAPALPNMQQALLRLYGRPQVLACMSIINDKPVTCVAAAAHDTGQVPGPARRSPTACSCPALQHQSWTGIIQVKTPVCFGKTRKEKTTPFGVNLLRSPVLHQALGKTTATGMSRGEYTK